MYRITSCIFPDTPLLLTIALPFSPNSFGIPHCIPAYFVQLPDCILLIGITIFDTFPPQIFAHILFTIVYHCIFSCISTVIPQNFTSFDFSLHILADSPIYHNILTFLITLYTNAYSPQYQISILSIPPHYQVIFLENTECRLRHQIGQRRILSTAAVKRKPCYWLLQCSQKEQYLVCEYFGKYRILTG